MSTDLDFYEKKNYEGLLFNLFKEPIAGLLDLVRFCIYSYTLNDKAHDLEHLLKVCRTARDIVTEKEFTKREETLIFMGCLLHDLGCKYDRKNHHLIGYGMAYEMISNYCPKQFSLEEIKIIATSVLEHRSSNKDKPTNPISEVVSIADSGRPNFNLYIKRAILFRLDNNLNKDILAEEVYKHMLEKFGTDGYHWISYPDLGLEIFKTEWDDFTNALHNDKHTLAVIKDMYEDLRSK